MKLPRKVKIGCYDISVVDWHPHAAAALGRYGEFSSLELLIRIDLSVNPVVIANTLLHELMHAIYWVYEIRDGDDQERTVTTMATGMTQVFKDNPNIVNFISDLMK